MSDPDPRIGYPNGASIVSYAHETPLLLLILTMLAVMLPTVAISQIIAHLRLDVVDDQMFGYYGWRILHGATVYVDIWDNKPPGIYWINALGFLIGADSYAGVIALCATALVAAHVCFFIVASSNYYRGAAALATVFASFYITHGYYQGGTNRTETFMMPCELAAVAFYMRGFARDRWWKWYAAGLFCGAAFLFKQVGLAAWGAMGLHTILLVVLRDITWRSGLQRCLLLAGGVVTVLAVAAEALFVQGALDDAIYATFTFNQAYFAGGDSTWWDNYANRHMLGWNMMPILRMPVLAAIAAVIHAFLWWVRPRHRPPEIEKPLQSIGPVCPRYMFLFGVWFAAAFYGAMVSPHAFRHYLVPLIPPLMLLVGYLINVLRTEVGLVQRIQQRAWVLVAFVVMGFFAAESFELQTQEVGQVWVDRVERGEPGEWEVIGDQVAELSQPDETIHCWGYNPGIYLRSRRPNASRYTTMEKIGQLRGQPEALQIQAEVRETLMERGPPALLVMSAGDRAMIKLAESLHKLQKRVAAEGENGDLILDEVQVRDNQVDVAVYLEDLSPETKSALARAGFVQAEENPAINAVSGSIHTERLLELTVIGPVISVKPAPGRRAPRNAPENDLGYWINREYRMIHEITEYNFYIFKRNDLLEDSE